jgi:hypothetical protein
MSSACVYHSPAVVAFSRDMNATSLRLGTAPCVRITTVPYCGNVASDARVHSSFFKSVTSNLGHVEASKICFKASAVSWSVEPSSSNALQSSTLLFPTRGASGDVSIPRLAGGAVTACARESGDGASRLTFTASRSRPAPRPFV